MDLHHILITGGNGMIGNNIMVGYKPNSSLLDITNTNSIINYINSINKPSCILHLASLNLRDCEKNLLKAIDVNINGTINMLNTAKQLDIPFVFLSSGAVFSSNNNNECFTENYKTKPNSVYGKTKDTAEKIVLTYEKSIIIRTGWLFGGQQKNHNKFVENSINNLILNKCVYGSNDFYGSPTFVIDLIEKMNYLILNSKYGIYHIINSGFANGYDIAIEIAKILNKPLDLVNSVQSTSVPNASLDRSKSECLNSIIFNDMRNWKTALKEYVNLYLNNIQNYGNKTIIPKILKETDNYKTRIFCRLCNNSDLKVVYKLKDTPPANHFVENLKYQESFPLTLSKCNNCNHFQLLEILNPSSLYSNYLYFSSVSNTMVNHLKENIKFFINQYNINYSDNILEIGANDGVCIKELLNLGYNNIIGVDPASNINKLHNLPIICDFFNSDIIKNSMIQNKKFKLIFAFHCLAHIEDIKNVFETVNSLLTDDGIFIFEVGYFNDIINNNNFDVIYHEHIDYHTCNAMDNFTKINNMCLFDVSHNNIQSGSIQFYICKNNNFKKQINTNVELFKKNELNDNIFNIVKLDYWKSNIINSINEINYFMISLVNNGKKIAGYGASAKSTTFLHQCNLTSYTINYIIDDNIYKQNLFTPGTHIPIKSKDYLLNNLVDYIIILSWNFSDDLINQLIPYINTNHTRIIIPFPKFKIL